MRRFIFTRTVTAVITVWGAVTIVFLALHLVPGGFAELYLGTEAAENPELIPIVRAKYGLDRPLPVQYGVWMGNLFQGDLGTSLLSRQPVVEEIRRRGVITLELTFLATLMSIVLGVPAGIIAGVRRTSIEGVAAQVVSMVGLSIPSFVLGTLLIYVVSTRHLGLPVSGYVPASEDLTRHFASMLLPTITLGAITMSLVMRVTRSSVLEVLSEPFITVAHSKGLAAWLVMRRHVMKNALIPTVTVVAINVGYLLSGAIIVETIFALPGLGRYALQGVLVRDYPMAQGAVLVGAMMFVLSSFMADIIYALLDPRIRY